uniref:Secreted protein n=1 Tax=Cacopsylla melanoneura TaxID=428564 RepID=A0A8D8LQU0_9HEMI
MCLGYYLMVHELVLLVLIHPSHCPMVDQLFCIFHLHQRVCLMIHVLSCSIQFPLECLNCRKYYLLPKCLGYNLLVHQPDLFPHHKLCLVLCSWYIDHIHHNSQCCFC